MSWKTKLVVFVIVFLLGVYVGASAFSRTQVEKTDSTISSVNFSPNGGCENQVVSWINRANSSIHVLTYSFTLDSVRNALIDAYNRNISIGIVFEHDNIAGSGSEYQNLKNAGIDVRSDTGSGYMHDKVMIVDGKVVLTGSFNWSSNAENENNENLVVITSDNIAAVYENEFQKIWNSATP
ncbi:phospholipase D-like domain-containing protein [Candidatus Bathyarchaeota archaeon]|nr:phospholipase D-like domain-containing protein [Candidatus Bathyarchaeota archaeon]